VGDSHLNIPICGSTAHETADTSLRAIGKQAHVLNSMVAFSTICVIAGTIGYVTNIDNE
jgi:hypothetical protein